jgi:hypothetical protein
LIRGLARTWLCAAILPLLGGAVCAQSRLAFAEYEISGPFAGVVFDAGRSGSAVVTGSLSAGESRRVVVPIPIALGVPPTEPRVATDGAISTNAPRFLGWKTRALRGGELPAALVARSYPAAAAVRVRAGAAVLLVLGAAFVAGLWCLRARRAVVVSSIALAGIAGGIVFHLARRGLEHDAPPIELLDGAADSTTWRRVSAARDALVLPAREPEYDLVTSPGHAPLRIEVGLEPGDRPRATAHGAKIVAVWSEPWPPRALDPVANALAPLAAVWLRDEGAWTFHGRWPLDRELGPRVPGADPPGWLVSGLPQGMRILVGELEPRGPGPGGPRTWVRTTLP